MTNTEKRKYILSTEDCEFIEKLILKNASVVRAVIYSVLGESFDQIGEECISDLYLLTCEKIDLLKKHKNCHEKMEYQNFRCRAASVRHLFWLKRTKDTVS